MGTAAEIIEETREALSCPRCVTMRDGACYYCAGHRAYPAPGVLPGTLTFEQEENSADGILRRLVEQRVTYTSVGWGRLRAASTRTAPVVRLPREWLSFRPRPPCEALAARDPR